MHAIGMQGKANHFAFVLTKVALQILLPLKHNTNGSDRVHNFSSTVQEQIVPPV
jgi:hypothetical protein